MAPREQDLNDYITYLALVVFSDDGSSNEGYADDEDDEDDEYDEDDEDDEDELTGLNSFVLRFSSPSSSRSV